MTRVARVRSADGVPLPMANLLASLTVGFLVATVAAAGVVTGDLASGGDKMTICHVPPGNPGAARTMEVSHQSWPSHEGHGDHEGACHGAEARAPASKPDLAPRTSIALRQDGEGRLDGDAVFDVVVANHGSQSALAVHVDGQLGGDGTWTVRAPAGAACGIDQARLACNLGDMPAGTKLVLRLQFDGFLSVCREVGTDLNLTAANDATAGDDHSRESVRVGACSPLDHDGMAALA